MSCFWNGVYASLPVVFWKNNNVCSSPKSLLQWFKKELDNTTDLHILCSVLWQGIPPSLWMLEENRNWILDYPETQVNHGHLTSTCDPFLILFCFLTQTDVDHVYMGSTIRYRYVGKKIKNEYVALKVVDAATCAPLIIFHSNRGHFQYIRTQY